MYFFSSDENLTFYLYERVPEWLQPHACQECSLQFEAKKNSNSAETGLHQRGPWLLDESPSSSGEFIHRSSFKAGWMSRSAHLPLCKVNEKHPESGQICREHHWSWPTQSMISEIKGRRREGNLFTVSRKSAKGNSSPQAVFEKLKGKSAED